MTKAIVIILFLIIFRTLPAQTRKELEEQRRKTLEEIGYVDNMIRETEKQKSSGLNDIRIIGNKLNLRERVLIGIVEEVDLLQERISTNELAIELMKTDLEILRKQYAETIIASHKTSMDFPEISFLLSAEDFNQGYKRLKYLQQMAQFRRDEAEKISELKFQIESTKKRLEDDLANLTHLRSNEQNQKNLLIQEQERKRRLINGLTSRERQLRNELESKKRIAKNIEAEINKLIEEERRKSLMEAITPEMKLISNNFIENKGKLPWPVEKGIITEKFGEHDHPVLTYVKENNPGIEITSSGKTFVRAIFKGEVVRIFAIPGANMSIIIKHGRYYSVYQNIINVRVKKNEMVETMQTIGEVYSDPGKGGTSVLKFMIFDEKEKVDPELWITKR